VDSADQIASVVAVREHDSSVDAVPVEDRNFVDVFDENAGGSVIWEIVATRY
tara:strand:- start:447 stop:602 length:156 start_codon:yes stop_codon:yes gene_type:complete